MDDTTTVPSDRTGPIPAASLLAPLQYWARETPDALALSWVEGRKESLSYARFLDEVMGLAGALLNLGIEVGDRVCLMGHTSRDWVLMDYAVLACGAVTVPVYDSSSASQVEWILSDAKPTLVVVEDRAMASLVREADSEVTLWVMSDGDLEARASRAVELAERIEAITDDSLASLVYTSGTTGRPKGCMLTHGNFRWAARGGVRAVPEVLHPQARTVMFLPLAHVFARVLTFATFEGGGEVMTCGEPTKMVELAQVMRPTFLVAVPRVLEKVLASVADQAKGAKAPLVNGAISHARARSERGAHSVLAPLYSSVYKKVRARLGGEVTHVVSGGAALDPEVGHFLRGVGIEVLEGYGLTETTGAVCINRPGRVELGTVGTAFDTVAVRISDDDELEVSGRSVSPGYWGHEPNAEWFPTGDAGSVKNGVVRITGRRKEILVTANGKNVVPGPLEDAVRSHPLVSQVLVVGDGKPFVGALITLDPDALRRWAEAHSMSASEARGSAAVRAEIEGAVERANRHVSTSESIRKFTILDEDFTEDNGQLTPTMKVRRFAVLKRHDEELTDLYAKR